MSKRCEITGLSLKDCENWANLHSKHTGTYECQTPSDEMMFAFDKDLENTVSNNRFSKIDLKRRNSLFGHLEKSIVPKFNNSSLAAFGSSETGLSLKRGDLDLCLVVPDGNQKRIVKRISGMMNGQGMENVKAISRATVPIVKFTDPRSGIDVDISINNTLALHNTKLLAQYSQLDERVKNLVICIKYWAFHRNISDAYSGTFSSYAWSILAIQHLQLEGIIPNLQAGENRTIVQIDDIDYDITTNLEAKASGDNDLKLSQLLYRFFERFSNWDWSNNVVSIRSGAPLSRDEKGWMDESPSAFEVIKSNNKKPLKGGEHHLPIEDPFNPEHDLCRVVRGEGELSILDELLRATKMWGEGSSWKEICETVDPERLAAMEPEDLFHDLRKLPDHSVKQMREKVSAELESIEIRISALDEEKKSSIRMANAMRGVVDETSELRKEHKTIISGLGARSKKINSKKKERDTINQNIILPKHMIEEELLVVYNRLTEEVDIHSVPSLKRERDQFSWFLELQAMHAKSIEATQLHEEFIDLVKLQKSEIKKMKIYETKHDEATEKLLSEEPLLKDKKITAHQIHSYDRRVQNIFRAIRQRQGEMHKLRREAGRLDAWLRKKQNAGSRKGGRSDKRRSKKKDSSNAQITIGDISELLSGKETSSASSKKQRKTSSKKAGMRKLGNLGAHRGSRGQFKPKD